ncbi:hypothetical protein [Candidatus Protofrankia californiensis]|uniref:hypothetical protein n=1 Tax=Candidatus Protofrankia californiensis TaxID=1839754 RepID=UPI001040E12A|nr:hypothetical protein [Candidatus Protofrankia californiensis]
MTSQQATGGHLHDATRGVLRPGLVSIATGRDVADMVLIGVMRGIASLQAVEVTVMVSDSLPVEDHHASHRLD